MRCVYPCVPRFSAVVIICKKALPQIPRTLFFSKARRSFHQPFKNEIPLYHWLFFMQIYFAIQWREKSGHSGFMYIIGFL